MSGRARGLNLIIKESLGVHNLYLNLLNLIQIFTSSIMIKPDHNFAHITFAKLWLNSTMKRKYEQHNFLLWSHKPFYEMISWLIIWSVHNKTGRNLLNTMRPTQNGHHTASDNCVNEVSCTLIHTSRWIETHYSPSPYLREWNQYRISKISHFMSVVRSWRHNRSIVSSQDHKQSYWDTGLMWEGRLCDLHFEIWCGLGDLRTCLLHCYLLFI